MWSVAGVLADAGMWPEAVAMLRDTVAADAEAESSARAAGNSKATARCQHQRMQVHSNAMHAS